MGVSKHKGEKMAGKVKEELLHDHNHDGI